MAEFHALAANNEVLRYALHVPIPNANNSAGLNWRTALLRSGAGGTTVLPDGDGTGGTISAAEKASIQSGAIYEHQGEVALELVPPAGQLAFLDALIAAETARVQAAIQSRLKWFGFVRDV